MSPLLRLDVRDSGEREQQRLSVVVPAERRRLKLARATSVVERLESLFATQGSDSGGRADAIATEVDERTNSVIVSGAS